MYLVRIEIPKFMKPFLVVLSIGRVGYLYRYLTLGSYTYETFVQNFSHSHFLVSYLFKTSSEIGQVKHLIHQSSTHH